MRQCIRQFKYRERRRLSLLFADLVRSYLTENLTGRETIDMVIPVPLHCSKLRKRGYNQAGLLASVLSDGLSAPAAQKVLLKTKDTRSQMGLTRKIRLDNLTGSFAVVDRTQISGKTVLLVDDVMTTGATLEACAKELLRGGAAEVKAFTLARVI